MSAERQERDGERSGAAVRDPRSAASLALLVLACAAVVGFYLAARWEARAPWSYDEYYHLGVAREMAAHFPLRTFPWAPFSILSEHFADKEPLFHLLLLPLARLPLETAGLAGVLAGQVFLVVCVALVLWRLRVPHAYAFVLGLAALGSMFALRVDMCRPHLLLMSFSVLVVGLLVSAPPRPSWPWTLALVATSALFSLAHAGGWIAMVYALIWAAAGLLVPPRADRSPHPPGRKALSEAAGRPAGGAQGRRFLWQPVLWTAAGWALGQLLHPNLPYNLRLLALQNFVVPFEASPAGNAALRSQLGEELSPPGLAILAEQWPVFLAPLAAAVLLLRRPRLRSRETLTAALIALAFLTAGSFFLRRLLEVGAPLGLLALAVVASMHAREAAGEEPGGAAQADRTTGTPAGAGGAGAPPAAGGDPAKSPRQGRSGQAAVRAGRSARREAVRAGRAGRPRRMARPARNGGALLWGGWGPWIVPFVLAAGALWTASTLRSYGYGKVSAPREMARWLGEHGHPDERVFTAQWADSAPLFYSAPQLRSIVALDPTFFFAQAPARFQEYVEIVFGRNSDPADAIQRDFGARYVTLWRMPAYEALARQLLTPPAASSRQAPAQVVYSDDSYLVLDLGPPPPPPARASGPHASTMPSSAPQVGPGRSRGTPR